MTREFDELLNTDPLLLAEKLTGKSYKEDTETEAIGFALLMAKSAAVKDEMLIRDDTYRSMPYEDALRIIVDLGFINIFSKVYTQGGKREVFYNIYWYAGIILVAESYKWGSEAQTTVNKIEFYGNWIPNDIKVDGHYTSSGHYTRHTPGHEPVENDPWVWSGHWHVEAGLRNMIDNLDKHGTWLTEWIEDPLLWLHSYGEAKLVEDPEGYPGKAFDIVTMEKVSKFPEPIRSMITTVKDIRILEWSEREMRKK